MIRHAVFALAAAAACAGRSGVGGAGTSADAGGGGDAGMATDAGALADAGAFTDAGEADGGPADGGPADAGAVDTGPPDSGATDSGMAAADAGCLPLDGGPSPCGGAGCLASAAPGSVVSLGGLDLGALPILSVAAVAAADAGTLVFSDDPETFQGPGILYEDTVGPGPVRLFVYHVNGGTAAAKLGVVLANAGAATVTAGVAASGLAGPSGAYVYVGKKAAERWMASNGGTEVPVAAGSAAVLDPALDGLAIPGGDLVNAIYDLDLSGPLEVVVAALPGGADTLASYGGLSVLPAQHARRGTFFPDDVVATPACPYDTAWGTVRLPLGVPGFGGLPIAGTDATTGAAVTLAGAYGVRTLVDLGWIASGGGSLALLLAPRGGDYAGAVLLPGGIVDLPSGTATLGDPTEAIVAGRFGPPGSALPVVWTLPGGSSSPVDLLLVPD